MDEHIFIDEYPVGDGGYELGETIDDISWIRKRMKCCKNPMERKQLEKQLNAAYKARKKARKNK